MVPFFFLLSALPMSRFVSFALACSHRAKYIYVKPLLSCALSVSGLTGKQRHLFTRTQYYT